MDMRTHQAAMEIALNRRPRETCPVHFALAAITREAHRLHQVAATTTNTAYAEICRHAAQLLMMDALARCHGVTGKTA